MAPMGHKLGPMERWCPSGPRRASVRADETMGWMMDGAYHPLPLKGPYGDDHIEGYTSGQKGAQEGLLSGPRMVVAYRPPFPIKAHMGTCISS